MLDANLCDDSLECCEWGHHHIAAWPGCGGRFARRHRSNWRRLSAFSPVRLFQSQFDQTNPATPSTARVRCGVLRSRMVKQYLNTNRASRSEEHTSELQSLR